MGNSQPKILLKSHYQAIKIRIVFWVLVIAAGFAIWGGWAIVQTWGISPADGGVLKPFWQRLAFGGFVAGLGIAAAWGMWLYLTLYALQITRLGDTITLSTMTPLGKKNREFSVSEVGESAYYHGQVRHISSAGAGIPSMGGIWVNAPWITLRVHGYKLPFILDVQAETIKTSAINRLAKGEIRNLPD